MPKYERRWVRILKIVLVNVSLFYPSIRKHACLEKRGEEEEKREKRNPGHRAIFIVGEKVRHVSHRLHVKDSVRPKLIGNSPKAERFVS